MSSPASTAQTALSLPTGGGAIKGIGETFQTNLYGGTANHSVPIALSPGRGGFGPGLALAYSSGHGNGEFGLGWSLALPRITRKTEKGLPRYDDSDVFVLSGSEDLVPWLTKIVDPVSGDVGWLPEGPLVRGDHRVSRYRPRTEGLFARIERWVQTTTGEIHWRTISKDNITSLFGTDAGSRLADPADVRRVYSWLLAETYDAFGNHSRYEYAADDPALYSDDPDRALPESFERNRLATNRYPRRMYYGNLPDPLLDATQHPITYQDGTAVGVLRDGRRYAFEVVFDYGDWEVPTILPHPAPPAEGAPELLGTERTTSAAVRRTPVRPDRFSAFRAGFEIRTLRRCRRVLMVHHFAELGGPRLVRSTDFAYTTDPDTQLSLLSAVTVRGYDRDSEGPYRSAAMPPLTFAYTAFEPHRQRFSPLRARGGELPPLGLHQPGMALVDLFGDGLPDVLHTGPAGVRYWRNLGDGTLDRPRTLAEVPAGVALDQPGVGFGDMTGNGIADLLVNTGPLAGFFETTPDGAWKRFTPYPTSPGFGPQDPGVRLLDLTGDGRSDALMTRDEQFLWFECLDERGFAPPRAVARRHDLDAFPDVFFDDPAGRVRLADMTGDGLNDIVTIHGGRVDYWPNLGYGRFGRRISMAHAPLLDGDLAGGDLDPGRMFLVDLTGTGCADLVYVDRRRILFWFNRSGNGWSDRQTLLGTPGVVDTTGLQFADVFGSGTATLVWSRDLGGPGASSYAALDFCGGVKPYVLDEIDNSMGATTRVTYAPSTRHFLADRAAGIPWLTALPFPVQVVDRVEIIDHVGQTSRVSTYAYHHGHYDGREREFCGFGRVDQFDAETFTGGAGEVPPVETRSWFHTGVYFDDRRTRPQDYRDLTARFRQEYYAADTRAVPLDEHEVEATGTPAEAHRALRGALLRTEVYAHDGSIAEDHPYQAGESRHRVTQVQPRAGNQHAVYLGQQVETLTYHYERNPADPRISHALTLQVDGFGNPLKALSVGYGRRRPDPALPTDADRERQTRTLITFTETRYTDAIDDPVTAPDVHRAPVPCETTTYELTGFVPQVQDAERFDYGEWVVDDFSRLEGAQTIRYEEEPDPARPQKRLIERARTFFRRDDLTGLLPLGTVESLALPGESHRLAFTAGLVTRIYGDKVDDAILTEHGYLRGDDGGTWWIPSARTFLSPSPADAPVEELAYARQHFFATHRARDPFGNTSVSRHDPYVLLVIETRDALANRTLAEQDYRVLQSVRLTDPNGNRGEVAFDTLGLVAGSAVKGKATEQLGDSLAGFAADLTAELRTAFLADPLAAAAELLGSASTRIVYDLDRYRREHRPVWAAVLSRETHASDPVPAAGLRWQLSLSYTDGFGRVIQTKVPAEPGPVTDAGPLVSPRWVGTGWTVFTNKGKPVQRFEPFFDDRHDFRFDRRAGVSSTLLYDPLERVVATLHPDHTFEKVVFDPWQQASWDGNDTVLIDKPQDDPDVGGFFAGLDPAAYLPTWFAARVGGELGDAERSAAQKTAKHAETPAIAYADSLGRPFLTITHNRFERAGETIEERQATRPLLDIEGNQRAVADTEDRVVMRYDFDMLGTRARSTSMEAGERWMLNDILGQPVLAWTSRGQRIRTTYDALRRPVDSFLADGDDAGAERLIGRAVFGEAVSDPERLNLRGRIVRTFDQAGVLTNEAYDFKGNLLTGRRQLALDHKATLDWSAEPALDRQVFVSHTTYDALNRATALTSPDGSVVRATTNAAGLLETTEVQLPGSDPATAFVTGMEYDAKGRRTLISYGNGIRTRYGYHPLTSRLTRCQTQRGAELLQDLVYCYDPVGNLTRIDDAAQQRLFFANQVVTPSADYIYDAAYRLLGAEGREHIGQPSRPETTWDDAGRMHLPHPSDGQAMRRYVERYAYDAAGNLRQLVHTAAAGNWTRTFGYDEASLIEPNRQSNRLSSTVVGSAVPERYRYDAHGNLTAMPHLPRMDWDFRDRLRRVDLGGGGTAYYVYDAAGQRIRSVVEKNGGNLVEERITLGGFEIFHRRDARGAVLLERTSLHVTDDQQRIACVDTRTRGTEAGVPARLIRYQLGNHLGSAALELDDAGRIISYEEYYPYGSTSFQAGRSVAEVSLKRYRFGGQMRDQETGLNHHGARYYAPWLGRWISCDPIGIKDGPNAYVSFHDNPVVFRDPNGLQNKPANFVENASTVKGGLKRMAQLGVQHQIEYGLALDPKSNQLVILKGTATEVKFGKLIALGHSHTGTDKLSYASTADLNEFERTKVKEHWIYGKADGWARYRYDAKTKTFDVMLNRPEGVLKFTLARNPHWNPRDRSPVGRASKWFNPANGPPQGPAPKLPLSRGRMIVNTTAKVVGIAGVASVAGDAIKNLHEGNPGRAAITVGIAGGVGYVLKRHPAAMILTGAVATVAAYDDQVKKEANAAGEALDDYLGFDDHSVIGGLNAAAYAVEKSVYNGVIKPIGTGIGEGAAAAYIRLTSDEYTLNPFKADWFPW